MERWEAILKLYSYHPEVNRYRCDTCNKLYKSDRGVYKHADEHHNTEINSLRDKVILAEL